MTQPTRHNGDQTAAETMHKVAAVSRSLRSTGSAIERMVQSASGGTDLTLAHWLILVHLSRARTCKQGEVNAQTGINTGYLTRLIDELEEKSMVRRRRSTEDRREILLSLTEQGRGAALALLAAIAQYELPGALDKLQSSLDGFLQAFAPEARP